MLTIQGDVRNGFKISAGYAETTLMIKPTC